MGEQWATCGAIDHIVRVILRVESHSKLVKLKQKALSISE
jgi:hypothetical protein